MVRGTEDPALVEKNYAGHKKYIEAFHPDFVKIMSDGFFAYPDPALSKIRTPEDLGKLRSVDGDHPWIQKQVELIRRVTALQGDTPYFYNIFSPSTLLKNALGVERYRGLLRTDPGAFAAALAVLARGVAVQAEQAITAGGADGVYLSVQNPDAAAISDETYKTYISPSDRTVLAAANAAGDANILHICGYEGAVNRLAAWTGYAARAYNWATAVEGVSLGAGKKLFGGKAVIGGFANDGASLIHTGSREAIEAFTERLIAEAGKTGVVIGADCTVSSDIALERLQWVREKAAALS
jgi:uroporphyrinogen decarboxylase